MVPDVVPYEVSELSFKKKHEKLKNNKRTSKYGDLVWLAEHCGFILDRQNSSHAIYKNDLYKCEVSFVKHSDGNAKEYNVIWLLDFIDEHDLHKRGEEESEE